MNSGFARQGFMMRSFCLAIGILVLSLVSALRAGHASAAVTDEAALTKAHQEIQSRCDISETRARLGTTQHIFRRVGWTGQCVNGLLHGEGTLTIDKGMIFDGAPPATVRQVLVGTMHAGKQIGPWLVQESGPLKDGRVESSFMTGLYSWADAPVPGAYRRNSDGSFTHMEVGYDGATIVMKPVAGTPIITAEQAEASRRLAADGSSTAAAPITFRSKLLADLMPGGKVSKAPESDVPNIRSKSVAVIVASDAEQELAKLDAFFNLLRIEDVSQDDPFVRLAIQRTWKAVQKEELLNQLATMLRTYFKEVGVMNDLAEFKASKHDYALVFDFNADIDGKALIAGIQRHASGSPGDTSWQKRSVTMGAGFFLVNRDLKVVFGQSSNPIVHEFMVFDPPTMATRGPERRNAGLKHDYEMVALRLEHSTRGDPKGNSELLRFPYLFRDISGYLYAQKNTR
jgi:hypothetical protein